MPAGGIYDLVGDAPGPSCADDSTRVHAGPLELINRVADGFRDLAWLVNVPREATGVIALTHRQHKHLGM